MSDHCSVFLVFFRKDLSAFQKALGLDEEDIRPLLSSPKEWPTAFELDYDDANYGWYDELRVAARKGLLFFGDHGSGGDYPAETFQSHNRDVEYAGLSSHGDYWVPTDSTGMPIKASIRGLRAYLRRREALMAQFKLGGLNIPEET